MSAILQSGLNQCQQLVCHGRVVLSVLRFVSQWVSRYKLKCTKKMVLTTTPSQGVLSFLLCLVFYLACVRVGIVVYKGTGLGWCSICIWICAWICIYFDFVGRAGRQGMCSVRRNRSYPVLQALTALPRHTLVSWGLSPRSVHPVISDFSVNDTLGCKLYWIMVLLMLPFCPMQCQDVKYFLVLNIILLILRFYFLVFVLFSNFVLL